MIFISHRGNISSKIEERENSPEYILEALSLGLDVEVDVWCKDDELFLGHDEPKYKVDIEFLQNEKLWCHAKNSEALLRMLNHNIHCFWHESDKMTLTSKKYIWAYPSKKYPTTSIAVLPENNEDSDVSNCLGICSDYILKYKGQYGEIDNI